MTALARDLSKADKPKERCLVMFDWDGVLADSLAVFSSVFLDACGRCGVHGLEKPGRLLALFDGNLYAGMEAFGMQRETVRRILRHFKRDTLARLNQITLFEGIPEALDTIGRGNVVIIVTANLSDIVWSVLRRDGVRCVSEVMGVEAGTSKVDKIRQALRNYPSLPAFYVGDTKGDMLEGRSAGAKTIAVLWGWHPEEKLREGQPDFLVRSPRGLAAYFR